MNAFKLCHKLRLFVIACFITLNIFLLYYYLYLPDDISTVKNNGENVDRQNFDMIIPNDEPFDMHAFLMNVNSQRINHLFKIIQNKESEFKSIMEKLNLIQFNSIVKQDSSMSGLDLNKENKSRSPLLQFKNEIKSYMNIKGNYVYVKESFIQELNTLSNNFSFRSMHDSLAMNAQKNKIETVILTAASKKNFEALQATLYHIHLYLPNYKIIVYDMGLTDVMHEKTKLKCRCELRFFNVDKEYTKIAPHVDDLENFSWKPLIIQEALKDHESVLYVDTSVRFHSGDIDSIIESSKRVGLIARYKPVSLNCYTNPKMYEWFQENISLFNHLHLVKTNMMVIYRNFLSSLILKAWVTCALDVNCISPQGSSFNGGFLNSIVGCKYCGCHRYDQNAITVINSFFYGHPKYSKLFLPAYAFAQNETRLFTVNEKIGMHYF